MEGGVYAMNDSGWLAVVVSTKRMAGQTACEMLWLDGDDAGQTFWELEERLGEYWKKAE